MESDGTREQDTGKTQAHVACPSSWLPRLHLPASTALAARSHVHRDVKTWWLASRRVSVVLVRTKHGHGGSTRRSRELSGAVWASGMLWGFFALTVGGTRQKRSRRSNGSPSVIEMTWGSRREEPRRVQGEREKLPSSAPRTSPLFLHVHLATSPADGVAGPVRGILKTTGDRPAPEQTS